MVAAGFVTNISLQTEETFLFNVMFRMGTFTKPFRNFGNLGKLEFVLKDA